MLASHCKIGKGYLNNNGFAFTIGLLTFIFKALGGEKKKLNLKQPLKELRSKIAKLNLCFFKCFDVT